MSAFQTSRSQLNAGTVFFYQRFEGFPEIKDRYFVVVSIDPTNFNCFTTTTNTGLLEHQYLKTEVSSIILAGSTCLPKNCVVDFRALFAFDDIMMSNRINTGRVRVLGRLPDEYLIDVVTRLRTCRTLERNKRASVCESLSCLLGLGEDQTSSLQREAKSQEENNEYET